MVYECRRGDLHGLVPAIGVWPAEDRSSGQSGHAEVANQFVFVFEGLDMSVWPSIAAAEGWIEAYDLGDLALYSADGSIVQGKADGHRVRLEVTNERRPGELAERLLRYLTDPSVSLSVDLANDPHALGEILVQGQRRALWPRRPRWLNRLIHDDNDA